MSRRKTASRSTVTTDRNGTSSSAPQNVDVFDPNSTKVSMTFEDYINRVVDERIQVSLKEYRPNKVGLWIYLKENWLLITPLIIALLSDKAKDKILETLKRIVHAIFQ